MIDAAAEAVAGNGVFNLAAEAYRDFILDEVKAAVKEKKRDVFYHPHILPILKRLSLVAPIVFHQIVDDAKAVGAWRLEAAIADVPHPTGDLPPPQLGTDLLAKHFPPPTYFVKRTLVQGLTLLAGKSKRGKTFLCLDMGMAMSFGRQAFRALDTRQSNVLFISLEDGEILVQENLHKIQPTLRTLPNMAFLYEGFPRLGDGALDYLKRYLDTYDVIFIDILGRILPDTSRMRKNVSEYQMVTDFLGPIHDLVRDEEKAIVITDHLRKAPSDDEFDEVAGSMAKIGVCDHVMLYKRQASEAVGSLRILGKRINHHKVVVTLVEESCPLSTCAVTGQGQTHGHLELMGEGEQYEAHTEETTILRILEEEGRPVHTRDIVAAMGLQQTQYHRIRMRLTRMYNEGVIGRRKGNGQWTLGVGRAYDDDAGTVPF